MIIYYVIHIDISNNNLQNCPRVSNFRVSSEFSSHHQKYLQTWIRLELLGTNPPWEAESELLIQPPLPLEMPHPSPSAGVEPRQHTSSTILYKNTLLYSYYSPRLAFINKLRVFAQTHCAVVFLRFFSDDFNDFLDQKTTGDWRCETPPSSHHED